MTHPRLGRLLTAGAVAAALVAPAAVLAPATAVSAYSSCAEVQFGMPTVTDGEYEITVFGKTVTVYCADMATVPLEYLTLPNSGGAFNFSQGGPGWITSFTRLRLALPSTAAGSFAIIPTDARFSDNAGQQWGNASSCGWFRSDANLDLRSTPFAMSTANFESYDWMGHSDGIIASSNNQVINIIDGRGDCGGMRAVSPFALTWIASVPVASDPTGQTATSGDDATFTASSTGTPTPTVQWQSSTDGTVWADVAGATSETLTLPDVTLADDGNLYRAVFTNNQGTDTTAAAALTVTPLAPSTTDPADTTVASGADATFTVTVGGDPAPAVQWETSVDGVWTALAGETGTQLVLEGVTTAQDGTLYRVHVQSTAGSSWSGSAELTVTPLAAAVSDPSDLTVTSADPADFSVTVTGDPEPTIQWQSSEDGGTTWLDMVGATSPSIHLADTTTDDDGLLFRATVTNSSGSAQSAAAELTVEPLAPTVSAADDVTVTSGQDAMFSVAVTGDPAPTVQWQVSTDGALWTDIAGATGTDLVLNDVTTAADGNGYRAVVTNAGGTATSTAGTLTVLPAPPVITSAPTVQQVSAGADATFTVAATGDPAPTYQWQTSTDNLFWTDVVGATGTSFTLNDVTAAQSGTFVRVYVANAGGAVASQGVRLLVSAVPAVTPTVRALPATGAETSAVLTLTGLLLLTGTGAVLVARRRRLG